MKYLFIVVFFMSFSSLQASTDWSIDFNSNDESQYWYVINDGVMGGVSESSLNISEGVAYFRGVLSLENNGGFASVRRVEPIVLSASDKPLVITVKGDGRTYQFRLRTNQGVEGVAYVASFKSSEDTWQTHSFSEDDFVPKFRGRIVRGAADLSFEQVSQIGFMLADKRPGHFQLAVKAITQ